MGGPAKGIATPLRLKGPLHGVTFVTPGGKSPYGMLDCRLALTLDQLSEVLARHGVTRVLIDNLYRPGAKLPGSRKPSQHGYGLAADIVGFVLEGGQELSVEHDWGAELGDPVCGPEARVEPETEAGVELRNLVCDVARAGLFHHMLTPCFNAAHENHVHFDLKRGDDRLVLE